MKRKLLLLCFFFCATAGIAAANTGPGNGEESKKADIAGGVFDADTKKPLSNVSVTVYSNSKKEKVVTTDNTGSYLFNDLKPGTYKFVFEKSGFKKVTKEKVVVRGDDGSQLNVELDEESGFMILPGQFFFSDF
jgi:hypothetical protein